MTTAAQAAYKAKARIIKALAHPTRLLIVEELSHGERCVCELKALIGAAMPTVSRHLGVLKGAGILEGEKRGVQVFYRLRVPCVLNFFKCVVAVQSDGRKPANRKSFPNRAPHPFRPQASANKNEYEPQHRSVQGSRIQTRGQA